VGLQVNNVTDERYFQAINPDNIGNTVALPKPPRTYELTFGYNF
jgi:outer membrane receptor protein involved in Fe transport